jgi:hypothetical protein
MVLADTLISALEVPGNGRRRYQITLTDCGTANAAIVSNRHGPPDRRHKSPAEWCVSCSRGPNTKVSPIPSSNCFAGAARV